MRNTEAELSRRQFLQGAGAISGGLLLGLSIPDASRAASTAVATHPINAWIHIAEDNSVTLLSARSEMGQGVHTALPALLAEELEVDLQRVKVVTAPAGAVYVNALAGAQITGASTSVRDGWERLRVAGAQAREMLVAAAAQKWNVDRSTLRADRGSVVGPGGKRATYGQLAAEAAKLPVPEKVALKKPSEFRLIGKGAKRLDTPSKVNGTAEFGIDVQAPGMVYASLEQCPVIGGKVKSFDANKAKAMPGVIDVVQIPDGVAVVADSYWRAFKARQELSVTWDEGPAASLSDKSMMEGMRAAAVNETAMPIDKKGDVAAAMAAAGKVIKAEYTLPLQAHSAMEPMNFFAHYSGGKCLLVGPTQFQQGAVGATASALGLKPEDVTVRTTFLGGGFGRRLELDFIVQAAQISKAMGRPVKLLWTREDDMKHDFYRAQGFHQLQAGLDSTGRPVAWSLKFVSQSPSQRAFGLPKDKLDPFMIEAAVSPYGVPNSSHEVVVHETGLRVGYWRAVSHNMNAFANESFIEELAAAAGKDPLAYRLDLLAEQPRLANVLKIVAQRSGFGQKAPAGRFRGIAIMEGYGTYMAQVAEISMNDGVPVVHKVTAAVDAGQMVNPAIVEAQVQSGIVFGIGAALYGEITLQNGRVQQSNFHDQPVLRMNEVPQFDITLVRSEEKPGGIGEPSTALIGPAIGNAIFAATGKRLRTMPFTSAALSSA